MTTAHKFPSLVDGRGGHAAGRGGGVAKGGRLGAGGRGRADRGGGVEGRVGHQGGRRTCNEQVGEIRITFHFLCI